MEQRQMKERYEQIMRGLYLDADANTITHLTEALCRREDEKAVSRLSSIRPFGVMPEEVKASFTGEEETRDHPYLRMCAELGKAYRSQGDMPPLRDGYVVLTADGKVAHRMYGNYHSPGPVHATYMQTLVNVNDIVEVRYEGEVIWRKPRNTIPASTAWGMVAERGYTVEQVKQEFEVKL